MCLVLLHAAAAFWLFNPLSLNVSTRGNAEASYSCCYSPRFMPFFAAAPAMAGLLLGLAMHMKPYPVIYLPAFLASIDADFAAQPTDMMMEGASLSG